MNPRYIIEGILSGIFSLYIASPFHYTPFYIIAFFSMTIVFTITMEALLVPILYSLVFACGYTLIYIYCIDFNKAKKQPLKVVVAILKRFMSGIVTDLSSIGDITECRCGDWYYKPLFKITRSEPFNG